MCPTSTYCFLCVFCISFGVFVQCLLLQLCLKTAICDTHHLFCVSLYFELSHCRCNALPVGPSIVATRYCPQKFSVALISTLIFTFVLSNRMLNEVQFITFTPFSHVIFFLLFYFWECSIFASHLGISFRLSVYLTLLKCLYFCTITYFLLNSCTSST